MNSNPDELKLHVDSDWKAQAEAEREKLRKIDVERETAKADESADKLPPADFRSIVGLLATQALGGLGAYGDPDTRRVVVDLPAAQFAIDLLGVLAEKTKGNLAEEESKELIAILTELRSRFVRKEIQQQSVPQWEHLKLLAKQNRTNQRSSCQVEV